MASGWLTTQEAATALGVKPATLYAYVSRGLIASRRSPDGRTSRFAADDVERLAGRGRQAARTARDTELLIRSAVSDVRGGRLRYRGRDAMRLAGNRSFEEVVELLWGDEPSPDEPSGDGPSGEGPSGDEPDPADRGAVWSGPEGSVAAARRAQTMLPAHAAPLDRLRVSVVVAASWDPLRRDLRPAAVRVAGRRLLATMVDALPLRREGSPPPGPAAGTGLAERLWPRLTAAPATGPAVAMLDAALVLLADHELAASTLAARVAASARADPYGVVDAGLATVSGTRHGAATLAAEKLLVGLDPHADPGARLDAHLRDRDQLSGFGHFLYPGGDPRAARLIELLRPAAPQPGLAAFDAVLTAARERGLDPPSVDLALGALTQSFAMPLGTAEAVFGIARTAGWIAHALEEYGEDRLIRPRAVYVGPEPS